MATPATPQSNSLQDVLTTVPEWQNNIASEVKGLLVHREYSNYISIQPY